MTRPASIARPSDGARRRLIFLGQGRLGNQVFQWLALNLHFPDCEIWAPSWTALPKVFELPAEPKLAFDNALLDRLLRRKFGRLLMRGLFGGLRLGHYVHEPIAMQGGIRIESGRLQSRRGLSQTIFVDGGYYQNLRDLLAPVDFQRLRVRADLLQRARASVQRELGGRPWPKLVMHVRRTDYLRFRPYGQADVTLPAAYYLNAAAEARRTLSGPQTVLIVTDDANWCRRELATLGDLAVVNDTEAVDFAILTMFPIAVIANSSFSLAAACVGAQVQRVIAPAYWFGRAAGQWLPPAIRSNDPRFHYI